MACPEEPKADPSLLQDRLPVVFGREYRVMNSLLDYTGEIYLDYTGLYST